MAKRTNGSKRVQTKIKGASRTRGSQQAETDINTIIRKYEKTGSLVHVTKSIPRFDDVSSLGDYKDAMEKVIAAQSAFSELSADLRNKFANDPGELIKFLNDSKNHAEAVEMGLVKEADSNLDGVVDAAEKAADEAKSTAAVEVEAKA